MKRTLGRGAFSMPNVVTEMGLNSPPLSNHAPVLNTTTTTLPAINDDAVDSVEDYERAVRKLKPGEQAKLKIVRIEWTQEDGRRVGKETEREVTVTVGGA